MNNDYIILFDENDEAYIAHEERRQHKYLKKIPNAFGPGKDLYLYTQKEIDAWEKRGKRTLSNRIRDKLGYDERDKLIDANRRIDSEGRGDPVLIIEKTTSIDRHTPDAVKTSQGYKNELLRDEARQRYKRTLLGMLDNATEILSKKLSDLIY